MPADAADAARALTDATSSSPRIEYGQLWPLLIVFGVACLGVLVEAFVPREHRYLVQVALAIGGVVLALVGRDLGRATWTSTAATAAARARLVGVEGTVVVDGPTRLPVGPDPALRLGGCLLFAERQLDGGVSAFAGQAAALPGTEAERQASDQGLDHTEVYPLLLFAVGGMMLFPASGDLLTMFVALEVLSLPLYLLCGLARRRRLLSQEAALKYFVLGAFSSGFFLYGVALIYGYAGSMNFGEINDAVRNDAANQTLLLIGMGMLAVGLLFKVGAAPFQAWTPDVYQGAPTAVTAFMAAATKIGGVRRDAAALLRRLRLRPLELAADAVGRRDPDHVRRRGPRRDADATSSGCWPTPPIAHTGFLLTGVLGVQSAADLSSGQLTSLQAVLFYLVDLRSGRRSARSPS